MFGLIVGWTVLTLLLKKVFRNISTYPLETRLRTVIISVYQHVVERHFIRFRPNRDFSLIWYTSSRVHPLLTGGTKSPKNEQWM